jgi:hypothetical protein
MDGTGLKKTRFPLNANYRPATNAVILLDMGHTEGRTCMGGIGKRK